MCFFSPPPQPKGAPIVPLVSPPPPTPTVGSVHYSWSKLKQGKVCDYEVEDMKHNERAPVCVCFSIFTFSRLWSKERKPLLTTINRRNCNDTHHSLICHVQFTVRDLWVNRNHHVLLLSATRYSCKQRSAWPLCTSETVC